MTTKCKCLNHLLQATNQSKFCFFFQCFTQKNYLRKQSESIASQTNSAHKRLQLSSQITEPISAWKFTHQSPKSPCILQCTFNAEKEFLCSLVFPEAGMANCGRQKKIQRPEWLVKEHKQKKAWQSKCAWIMFQW